MKYATEKEIDSPLETLAQARFWVIRLSMLILGVKDEEKIGSVATQEWVAAALGPALDCLAAKHQRNEIASHDIAEALRVAGVRKAFSSVAHRGKAA